ncbi:MAG TPA: hypothetical protein VJU16_09400 [Planctomycetota bacterium]|nr:hypothetical protein [Planctomycetota bacterium]
MTYVVVAGVVAAIAVAIFFAVKSSRMPGYRGAIGFKNQCASEIGIVKVTGFSQPIECRALSKGGHSFNFIGRQDLPGEVQVEWRLVGENKENKATISLNPVPKDAADGELFLVLSSGGDWTAEYAPKLRTDKLS